LSLSAGEVFRRKRGQGVKGSESKGPGAARVLHLLRRWRIENTGTGIDEYVFHFNCSREIWGTDRAVSKLRMAILTEDPARSSIPLMDAKKRRTEPTPVQYTVWRVDPHGEGFQVMSAGTSSVLETSLYKSQVFNERLMQSEPESRYRYIVKDFQRRQIGPTMEKLTAGAPVLES